MPDEVKEVKKNDQSKELLDVLDENGVFQGRVATRGDVHRQGLWHRAIIVALVNDDNKVLIQKRSLKKEKFAGLWDLSVAGHLPAGQDSVACAAAEVMEEVGYMLPKKIQLRDFRFMVSFRNQISLSDTFIENQFYDFFIYNVGDLDINTLRVQESEVGEIKWATAFEIKNLAAQGLMHPRNEWIEVLYRYITKF